MLGAVLGLAGAGDAEGRLLGTAGVRAPLRDDVHHAGHRVGAAELCLFFVLGECAAVGVRGRSGRRYVTSDIPAALL